MGFQLPSSFLPARRPSSFSEQDYLIGLRGLLVIESFLWCFLQVFVPTAVAGSANSHGPLYQVILRKTLSVLFWNEALIYSFFIFLSARLVCIPFLKDSTPGTVMSSVFRRCIRLWFPTAVAFSIATLIFSQQGVAYIDDFKAHTGNATIQTPRKIPSFLNFFNSLFEIFWITKNTASQAANTAFPSQTLWMVNTLFEQGYTVYMTMVIIPYTRNSWRVKALICFILTAWWVQSWAWYSISGLLLADVLTNMGFREKSRRGMSITRNVRFPLWILYATLMFSGLIMQYLWTAWRPQYVDYELQGHTGLYNTGGLNSGSDLNQPQARDDNYLIILGFFLLLEHYEWIQMLFKNPLFLYLGRRSFSYFLVQSLIIYTAGVKVFMHLRVTKNWPLEPSAFICFIVCLPTVALSSEIFYRVVDYPAIAIARFALDWIRK